MKIFQITSLKLLAATTMALYFLTGCSSAKLVDEWQNPEEVNFQANKVLVIGVVSNAAARRNFESEMARALEKNEIVAVRSIDFFESEFTNSKKSAAELDKIEQQLLDAGFDAVLFSKVTGQEKKVSVIQSYKNLEKSFQSFGDYFYNNQHIYAKEELSEYSIYNTETSVYCLCPGKPRELLWIGKISVYDGQNNLQNIKDYVKTVIARLREKRFLIVY